MPNNTLVLAAQTRARLGSRSAGAAPAARRGRRPMSEPDSYAAACRETGSVISFDLSRRTISVCATWRSRLESSRTANVCRHGGSLQKVIVLSGDGHGVSL